MFSKIIFLLFLPPLYPWQLTSAPSTPQNPSAPPDTHTYSGAPPNHFTLLKMGGASILVGARNNLLNLTLPGLTRGGASIAWASKVSLFFWLHFKIIIKQLIN